MALSSKMYRGQVIEAVVILIEDRVLFLVLYACPDNCGILYLTIDMLLYFLSVEMWNTNGLL